MWKCSKCKEESEDNFDSCWSCGTARDGTPPAEPFPEPERMLVENLPDLTHARRSSESGKPSIMTRYTDAYVTARTVTAYGATVKSIAWFIGGGIGLIGLIAGSQSMQYALGGLFLGAVVAIPIYILGVLVSAQGQILKATLDAAVNSSPLLNKDQMRQIMSLD